MIGRSGEGIATLSMRSAGGITHGRVENSPLVRMLTKLTQYRFMPSTRLP